MKPDERKVRQEIIDHCRLMNDRGLNQGTSGNMGVRMGDGMLNHAIKVVPMTTSYPKTSSISIQMERRTVVGSHQVNGACTSIS